MLSNDAGRYFLLEGFAADGGVVDDYDGHDDVNHGEWWWIVIIADDHDGDADEGLT